MTRTHKLITNSNKSVNTFIFENTYFVFMYELNIKIGNKLWKSFSLDDGSCKIIQNGAVHCQLNSSCWRYLTADFLQNSVKLRSKIKLQVQLWSSFTNYIIKWGKISYNFKEKVIFVAAHNSYYGQNRGRGAGDKGCISEQRIPSRVKKS